MAGASIRGTTSKLIVQVLFGRIVPPTRFNVVSPEASGVPLVGPSKVAAPHPVIVGVPTKYSNPAGKTSGIFTPVYVKLAGF